MLSKRRRISILLIILVASGIALGALLIGRVLNVGISTQDPLFFDRPMFAQYAYNNGTHQMILGFSVTDVRTGESSCLIRYGSVSQEVNYTHDGYYIDPTTGTPTENQSLFWIHIITGIGSEIASYEGKTYNIFDPIGIIGAPNISYTITITEKHVYWPEEAPLHGAQFSLLFIIHDLSGVQIGVGEMDGTCGLIFTMQLGSSNYQCMQIVNTNYDISRNRFSAIIAVVIVLIITTIVIYAYVFYKKKFKQWKEPKEDTVDTLFLMIFGAITLLVDIFNDVWTYAMLGFWGNILVHSSIIVVGAIFCLYRGYKFTWLLPGILEIAFVISIVFAVGDSYVPHLTAFMGLTVSFLWLLWLNETAIPERRAKLKSTFQKLKKS